jgi:hypothetical protein
MKSPISPGELPAFSTAGFWRREPTADQDEIDFIEINLVLVEMLAATSYIL